MSFCVAINDLNRRNVASLPSVTRINDQYDSCSVQPVSLFHCSKCFSSVEWQRHSEYISGVDTSRKIVHQLHYTKVVTRRAEMKG